MQNVTFFAELQNAVNFSMLNQADTLQFERLFGWILDKGYDIYDMTFAIQMMAQPQQIFQHYIEQLDQRIQQFCTDYPRCYAIKEMQMNLAKFQQHIATWQDKAAYSIQALVMGKQLYQYQQKLVQLQQKQQQKQQRKQQPQAKPFWQKHLMAMGALLSCGLAVALA